MKYPAGSLVPDPTKGRKAGRRSVKGEAKVNSWIHLLPPPTWHYRVLPRQQFYTPHKGSTQDIGGTGLIDETGVVRGREFNESQHGGADDGNQLVIEELNASINEV
ncbi:hypothetical protein ACH5RR_003286 [Cinchona calisaya]|uniref:Uncharacterized protein n=1 Tax=Cinchona calisaya TaxID=153742 RepID=A0ABD3AUG0_9GENT